MLKAIITVLISVSLMGAALNARLPGADVSAQAQVSPVSSTAEYVLLFTDAAGAPVPGVMATVCDETTCNMVTSDADGRVALTLARYPYEVHIIKAPAAYALDNALVVLEPDGGETRFTLAPK